MKNPNIVALGGGTGLSNLLCGLKKHTSGLTAVVTVTDDGGSSGMLRRELGILPPGDIRNCLVALSEEESLMAQLFQYRFPYVGSLSGHSFGNLFLTAMSALAGGFDKGIARAGEVLAIRGRVLPVTLRSVTLKAKLSDGRTIQGETNISSSSSNVKKLSIHPFPPPAAPAVLEAIASADAIALGPGSLFTSVISNLLVDGIVPALIKSPAPKIYICNIMTQPGETSAYRVSDHISAIERHACKGIIDYAIVNTAPLPARLTKKYAKSGSFPVQVDKIRFKNVTVIGENVISDRVFAHHDSKKLASLIIKLISK